MEHFLEFPHEMKSITGDKRVIPGYQWIILFLMYKAEQRFTEISSQSPSYIMGIISSLLFHTRTIL